MPLANSVETNRLKASYSYWVSSSSESITSETAATVDHIYGFSGRERDEESDLQFNRVRYYDPAGGRWISEDLPSNSFGIKFSTALIEEPVLDTTYHLRRYAIVRNGRARVFWPRLSEVFGLFMEQYRPVSMADLREMETYRNLPLSERNVIADLYQERRVELKVREYRMHSTGY